MQVEVAHTIVRDALTIDPGRFYNRGEGLSLGVGQIYSGVRYPIFNRTDRLFDTSEGAALVLTHECDVDASNARPFTDYILVCPIIRLEALVAEYSDKLGDERLRGFLVELANRRVSRVAYLPWGLGSMPYGGAIYLNQITSTHVSEFEAGNAALAGATTAYGLRVIDQQLTNHLLRPKAEELGLSH